MAEIKPTYVSFHSEKVESQEGMVFFPHGYLMRITLFCLAILVTLSVLAPSVIGENGDECDQITTWSDSDANLGGSYTTPVRFGFKNNPDKYIDYFYGADHDHTGFLASYSIPGWGDIELEIRFASFENHAVALSEFDDWADEHCIERNNYFGITKREGASCYKESWQHDPKTGEIIGCSTLWITEVYKGCVITIIDSGLAGEYIPDANGCDNVKTIHYDVLNKVKELIDEKCESTSIIIYPHEQYIDKGAVFLKYLPNTRVLLRLSKGHAIEFENYTEDIFTTEVTTDEGGEARARVIYTYESIEDMLELSPVTMSAFIETKEADHKIAEYKIDAAENWKRLLSEFKNPDKCPGARANPCTEWFRVITCDYEGLNGPANNYYEFISRFEYRPFYTYKGQSDFVCGAYQERILSWFYNKRFNENKVIASQVNGIECLPYNVANGLHKFVGIFPAGISAQHKLEPGEDQMWFLDPWRAQKPRILTVSDELVSIKTKVLAAGGFTIIFPAGGAILWVAGGAWLYVSDRYEGFWDYLTRLLTTVWGTVRFDSDYKPLIDIPSENDRFAMEQVKQVTGIKQNFDDPEYPKR